MLKCKPGDMALVLLNTAASGTDIAGRVVEVLYLIDFDSPRLGRTIWMTKLPEKALGRDRRGEFWTDHVAIADRFLMPIRPEREDDLLQVIETSK